MAEVFGVFGSRFNVTGEEAGAAPAREGKYPGWKRAKEIGRLEEPKVTAKNPETGSRENVTLSA